MIGLSERPCNWGLRRGLVLKKSVLAGAAVLIALGAAAVAQTAHPVATAPATTAAAFDVADVHSSYHRYAGGYGEGTLAGDRYILHQATMLGLIGEAYDVNRMHVVGRPSVDGAEMLRRVGACLRGEHRRRRSRRCCRRCWPSASNLYRIPIRG